jgi:hypothetical protein
MAEVPGPIDPATKERRIALGAALALLRDVEAVATQRKHVLSDSEGGSLFRAEVALRELVLSLGK